MGLNLHHLQMTLNDVNVWQRQQLELLYLSLNSVLVVLKEQTGPSLLYLLSLSLFSPCSYLCLTASLFAPKISNFSESPIFVNAKRLQLNIVLVSQRATPMCVEVEDEFMIGYCVLVCFGFGFQIILQTIWCSGQLVIFWGEVFFLISKLFLFETEFGSFHNIDKASNLKKKCFCLIVWLDGVVTRLVSF